MLTPGKIRGLSTLSSAQGTFKILAADHRDSMRVLINREHPEQVPVQTLVDIKLALLREVAPHATGVMLDPVYSVAQGIASLSLPGHIGFLCALEEQGYTGKADARKTVLLNGWSVEKAKRIGASAIKLLVHYHPHAGEVTDAQEAVIRGVITDCQRYDIPLFLEPLYYLPDKANIATDRRTIVIETVKRLGELRPDVLKIQFPEDVDKTPDTARWMDACIELNEASPVPWALLSGGDSFDSFKMQVEVACKAGCSGFMVGRAIWREVIEAPPGHRAAVARDIVLPRFEALSNTVDDFGQGWQHKHDLPALDEWDYQHY